MLLDYSPPEWTLERVMSIVVASAILTLIIIFYRRSIKDKENHKKDHEQKTHSDTIDPT